jgi:hypothetical protein
MLEVKNITNLICPIIVKVKKDCPLCLPGVLINPQGPMIFICTVVYSKIHLHCSTKMLANSLLKH